MWWRDAVVYQVYPRSFQDTDGDGVGDLRGAVRRLDHVERLGAAAIWLSPIYPSPQADSGYDVADYVGVDPTYGTLADLDAVVAAAHARGLRVLLDLVPSHTSIEHPWFRDHPDRYIWADGEAPPNRWRSAFGGSAWARDERSGRWYLHSFYPEQADLDWRNPEVAAAMAEVVRFWLARGVDGFRVDAVDRLMKDPQLRENPPGTEAHQRNHPDVGLPLAVLREAAGDSLLVGEAVLPTAELGRYLDHVDTAFAFDLMSAPWDLPRLRRAIEAAIALERRDGTSLAWVLSNHDFPRLATRVGEAGLRAAAMLLLTLPGPVFVYQGDEIGMRDGPGAPERPVDRAGRDAHRHPMQWDGSPLGGFTTGEPWLPPVDPAERNVADQEGDPGSLLSLYRSLIALRPALGEGLRMLESEPGVLAYARGDHMVALNLGDRPRPLPVPGEPVLVTHAGERLPPGGGAVVRT